MASVLAPYLFLFSVFAFAGGLVGFVKAKSKASVIAGTVSAILLAVAGFLVLDGKVTTGAVLGLVVSLALLGRFAPGFFKTWKAMPAGIMTILGVVGLVLSIGTLVG